MTMEQCEESYRRWLERKRKREERLRAKQILLLYQDVQFTEQRRARRSRDKESKAADSMREREQDMKVNKTRDEFNVAYAAFEDRCKRLEGDLAYRRWLRTNKNQSPSAPFTTGELNKAERGNRAKNNLARFVFSPLVEAKPSPRAMRPKPELLRDVREPCPRAGSPRDLRRNLSPRNLRNLRSPRRQLSPQNLRNSRSPLSPLSPRSPRPGRNLSPLPRGLSNKYSEKRPYPTRLYN